MDLYIAEMIGFRIDEIANALGITLVIAKEQVLVVENRGLLCRDESVYGIAFYKNIFQ
jgi:ESCRT-II complex subunit VPS36